MSFNIDGGLRALIEKHHRCSHCGIAIMGRHYEFHNRHSGRTFCYHDKCKHKGGL